MLTLNRSIIRVGCVPLLLGRLQLLSFYLGRVRIAPLTPHVAMANRTMLGFVGLTERRMRLRARKLLLTAHIVVSVGWLGALAVFLAHALVALVSRDDRMVHAASIAMGVTSWFVILPLSIASVATGALQALGSAWGLLRHYWLVFKLLLTLVATIVLLLKLEPIGYLAAMARVLD